MASSAVQRVKTTLETLSTVLVIVAASGLIWTTFFKRPTQATQRQAPPAVEDVADTIANVNLTNVMGKGNLAIVEFTDFQCPFCARHNQETFPSLKNEFVATGKARYISMHLPLQIHAQARHAAEAAECAADQGQYWEMRELLFANQRELAITDFVSYATDLALNGEQFKSCLVSDAVRERVMAHETEAKRLGVNATPALFLGRVSSDGNVHLIRRINGARPFDVFKSELEKIARVL
jgi:protein-disulfide isomerase